MKASIFPWEVASKHSNACMIWPAGNTSILKRPPLISSTTFASRRAAPCCTSSAAVKAVDIRHCTFGCAMTLGASVMPAAATAAATPPTFAMNLRRSVMMPPLAGDELMVGAFGDVVPRPHECLELRVRRVDFPGHRALLGLLLDGLAGKLLELAQHRGRVLNDLDL